MGRAAVRSAIAAYLTGADLPFVGTVFAERPSVIQEEDYELSVAGAVEEYVVSPGGTAAVLIVNIPGSHRSRHAITGEGFVSDFTVHDVQLELIVANAAGEAGQCQIDHEAIADKLVAQIRASPNLGAPNTVWAAGEFTAGVTVRQSAIFNGPNGTTVFIVSVVTLEAWEDIEAAAGT